MAGIEDAQKRREEYRENWKRSQERRKDWHPFDNPLGRIRLILLVDWDPFGVFHYPGASDEYDDYAVKVYEMAQANASREAVSTYLSSFKTGRRIQPYDLSLDAVVDKLFFVFDNIG
jgi:hypothetical protein